jgi:hypothetical protein
MDLLLEITNDFEDQESDEIEEDEDDEETLSDVMEWLSTPDRIPLACVEEERMKMIEHVDPIIPTPAIVKKRRSFFKRISSAFSR